MTGVNKERLEKALAEIRRQRKVSEIFHQFGFYTDPVLRGEEAVIACPFHVDESPSLGINDGIGKWHCFSCNRGGDVVSAYQKLMELKTGRKLRYEEAVDTLILEIPHMKERLSFVSVKEFDIPIVTEDFQVRRLKKEVVTEKTMNDVFRRMKRGGKTSFQDIMRVTDLMLYHMTPDVILTTLTEKNKQSPKEVGESVSDLLAALDW